MVRELKNCLKLQKFNRNMFFRAQMETVSLCSAHWQRYPKTVFYDKWIEAKLNDPSSLNIEPASLSCSRTSKSTPDTPIRSPSVTSIVVPTSRSSPTFSANRKAVTAPVSSSTTSLVSNNTSDVTKEVNTVIPKTILPNLEMKAKIESQLKVKTFDNFMSDPSGFKAFKAFLEESRVSMEYLEYMLFWVDIERYKGTPSESLAKQMFQKYLVSEDPEELCLIQLPQAIFDSVQQGLDTRNAQLFNSAQVQVMNRLKKVAFNKAFFSSINFENYVNEMVVLETSFLEDVILNDSQRLKSLFMVGKPSFSGLDMNGLQTVLQNILQLRYNIKVTNSQLLQYSTTVAKVAGFNNKFLSFHDFQIFCYGLIHEPCVPPHLVI
eukprot:TRINITY_DN15922_c0_g2_i1.p1 TRINITY_DN15922_c0_g2~~TRINITY_DN15922_c0_g2_i1.p1  ORF type:complete len:378 (-),score=77.18 TRINITY_DN15922_c0_g2_i1:215-1348(-)